MRTVPRNPRPVEVAERLERAATRIEQKGWCRGSAYNGERRCALGAIWYPEAIKLSIGSWSYNVGQRAAYVFDHYIAHITDGCVAVDWNDQQTDRRKVVRHLRKCARLVREHKQPINF